MDKKQARDIVRDSLDKSFTKETFTRLVKELFNQIDESKAFHARGYVPESYKKYVKTYERIASYTDPNGLKIDILIVYLQSESTLERARTSQRNFIAHYLKERDQKDAGLVGFVSPEPSDWRFSLVKMDYRFAEGKDGKVKVKEEFTPARRWSFLVGTNESSHTAQSRLAPLIADDTHNPTLAELEEAFNIETVTKEFFTEYRNLFLRVKEALDVIVAKDATIKSNFEQNGVNTVDFAKKLMGQIIFLYFLQKKGWFGVARDAAWGTGSKQFLRELFEKKNSGYKNFFNDILEPLFYEALRLDRSHEDHYYSQFNCKIPFLNGGLFDPINGYDWAKTDILISNELFSNNSKTSKGDTGDGILDVFDRYNFTVKEDEPLEKEVAIDPELLGKAYEKFNAIRPDNFDEFQKALKSGKKGEESKFNKQFGVYYTPREIVHYMCQQSLINYLYVELNNGIVTYEKPGEKQTDILGNMGKSGQLDLTIEHNAKPIIPKADIETLIHFGENVSENEATAIIKEENINAGKQKTTKTKSLLPDSIRNNAAEIDCKLAGIKVCDPAIGSGAFPVGMMSEIVRARNTLSNFIKNTDRTIYHFKRECIENSLYGVDIDSGAVEIAKLRLWLSLVVDEDDIRQIKPLPNLDYKIVCGNSLLGVEKNLFNSKLFIKLEEIKPHYFNETNPTKKQEYKEQIDGLILQITNGYSDFDFEVYFSEVFHEKGGFDVVIGNPPYVNAKTMQKNSPKERVFLKNTYKLLTDRWDLYLAFIEKAMNISGRASVVTMIIPNAFVKENYSKKMREYLINNKLARSAVFYEYGIFEASVKNIVLVIQKPRALEFEQIIYQNQTSYTAKNVDIENIFNSTDSLLARFLICERILGDVCFVSKGMVLNADELVSKGVFVKDDLISDVEDDIHCKPYTEGKWIDKYQIKTIKYLEWGTNRVPSKISRPTFPALYEKEKIFINKLGNIKATYDDSQIYCDQTIRVLVRYIDLKNIANKSINSSIKKFSQRDRSTLESISKGFSIKFILSLLNSKLYNYLINILRTKESFDLNPLVLRKLPIPNISFESQKPFEKLVGRVLMMKRANLQADTSEMESEIDRMVYALYGLTAEEIKIVEGEK